MHAGRLPGISNIRSKILRYGCRKHSVPEEPPMDFRRRRRHASHDWWTKLQLAREGCTPKSLKRTLMIQTPQCSDRRGRQRGGCSTDEKMGSERRWW